MSAPNNSKVGQLLSDIGGLYESVCAMTKQFLSEFSIPALNDLLRERAMIIRKIDSEKARLLMIGGSECWPRYDEYREIGSRISTLTAYDREIALRVTSEMNSVSRELSQLSDTSNAAKMYTRHCRA